MYQVYLGDCNARYSLYSMQVFMKAKQIDTYDVGIIIHGSPNRYVNNNSSIKLMFVCPLMMMVINYARYALWIILGGVKND